jgi:hypothetical protein
MHEIIYPNQLTYFIAWTDSTIFSYGKVEPAHTLTSGQPHLWTTLVEQEWHDKLLNDFNFTIPEEPTIDPE